MHREGNRVADKKIMETPDFIKGLLKSADAVDKALDPSKIPPRYLLNKLTYAKLEEMPPAERRELGIYQARVVLIVLAVELALKFLWEREKGNPAGNQHDLDALFKGLSCPLRVQLQDEYWKQANSPPYGWETLQQVFERCKGASIQWRYLVEKPNFPTYVMHATYLKYAALTVLQVSKQFAPK